MLKMIFSSTHRHPQFAYVEDDFFINAPSPMIVPGNKYLLAILNSKIADWYIRQLGVTRNGGYFEYKPMFVEQLPIPILPEDEQQSFIEIVDKIHEIKMTGGDTLSLEAEIDEKVFAIYGLSAEEISYVYSESSDN